MFRMFWIFTKIKVFQYGPFQKFIIQRLRNKCPYSHLFSSTCSYIRTEYGKIPSISPYWVRMQENADQNNSEYGHLYAMNLWPAYHKNFNNTEGFRQMFYRAYALNCDGFEKILGV